MSKELYDLCRRYKHFYNKQKDVESWSRKYHDLDLSKAIGIADAQLREATHNLQIGLFKEFGVECTGIYAQNYPNPTSCVSYSNNPHPLWGISDVEFHNSYEFINCLVSYIKILEDK